MFELQERNPKQKQRKGNKFPVFIEFQYRATETDIEMHIACKLETEIKSTTSLKSQPLSV